MLCSTLGGYNALIAAHDIMGLDNSDWGALPQPSYWEGERQAGGGWCRVVVVWCVVVVWNICNTKHKPNIACH